MSSTNLGPVKRLLASLDRDDRYVVMLHYADGLTLREIAAVLDLPVRVVESVLERMRGRLLAAIEQAEADAEAPTFERHASAA